MQQYMLETNQRISESCARMEVHDDQLMTHLNQPVSTQFQIKFKSFINFYKLSLIAIRRIWNQHYRIEACMQVLNEINGFLDGQTSQQVSNRRMFFLFNMLLSQYQFKPLQFKRTFIFIKWTNSNLEIWRVDLWP